LALFQAVQIADLVVFLENGCIKYCGKASDSQLSSFLSDELQVGSAIDGAQNARKSLRPSLSSDNLAPLDLDKDVKNDVLVDNRLTHNMNLDMDGKADSVRTSESGEISVACIVPPVPLVEEEGRQVGRVQASVYR
jgi:hypothetical protein